MAKRLIQSGAVEQGGGGMSDTSPLKSILIQAALSDPKNASKYASILSMVQPSASEVAAQDKKKGLDEEKNQKLQMIDEAVKLLRQKKKIKTGPLAGKWLEAKVKWGLGASKDERHAFRIISELGAEKMFEIGGKVLPVHERELLERFVPSPNIDNELNIENLTGFRTQLTGLYNKYQSGAVNTSIPQNISYPESLELDKEEEEEY